jgi:hypothetical protein
VMILIGVVMKLIGVLACGWSAGRDLALSDQFWPVVIASGREIHEVRALRWAQIAVIFRRLVLLCRYRIILFPRQS